MKKIKNLVIGGLQQKIFNLVLVTILLVVAAYTIVLLFASRGLTTLVAETNEQQEASLGEISGATMDAVVTESLGRSTQMEAYIADEIFCELKGKVTMLGDYAEKLFTHPSDYESVAVSVPDAANDGKAVVQLLTEEGVDVNEPTIAARLGLVGNMQDMLESLFETSDVNSCFIAMPDGTILIADDRSGAKFTDSGELLTLAVRERPWYTGAVEDGTLHFTELELDAFTGQIGIVCSLPVYVNDQLVAIVGADYFLDSIRDAVATSGTEENGFICIVNQDGHIVFAPDSQQLFTVRDSGNAEDLRQSSDTELAAFVTEALSTETGVQIVTIGEKEYYMAGAPLPTVGWAIMSVVEADTVRQSTVMLQEQYAVISNEALEVYQGGLSNAKRAIVGMLLVILVLGIGASLTLAKKIIKPLNTMTKRVASLGGNDLQFFMEDTYRTDDEIEVLAESFAKLSAKTLQYVEQVKHVTAEKERIGAELNLATAIQANQLPHLFPAFPDRTEFDIYATMTPAKEVGGDFYDFFLVDDDHIALVIADVSGKGVPAALFMMISRILIRNRIQNGETPGKALANVNDQLLEGNEAELFVTVWLAIVDIKTGKGVAANAGHEHPTLRRAGGQYELVVYRHSPAVATIEGIPFREHEFELHPGDSLFVYTDGVAEATDAKDELFGTDRMLEALNRDPDADAEHTLKNVMEGIDAFVDGAEQFDDITMMCFRYNGLEK